MELKHEKCLCVFLCPLYKFDPTDFDPLSLFPWLSERGFFLIFMNERKLKTENMAWSLKVWEEKGIRHIGELEVGYRLEDEKTMNVKNEEGEIK